MQKRRRRILGSIATLGLATVAGCSSASDDTPDTAPQSTSRVSSQETSTLTPTTTLTPTNPSTLANKIAANDGDSNDRFGSSVAIAGDGSTAVIGALYDENPNGERAGAAYVFEREDSSWTQKTKVVAEDGNNHDNFGYSVALSDDGSTAVIGAPGVGDYGAGSAYVFSSTSGSWSQEAKLAADNTSTFGKSVAVAGDGSTAIIGGNGDSHGDDPRAGSAYIFSRADDSWTQNAELGAGDGDGDDLFGGAVALSRDGATAIIGAPGDEDPNGRRAGSAYVFSEANGSWAQRAKLAADDGESNDEFGESVAVAGDGATAIIGAYVFSRDGQSWTQKAKLTADDGDEDDIFGASVTLAGDGSAAIVGAPGDGDSNGESAGSAYVFSREGQSWTQKAKLAPDDGDTDDLFGGSVALSRNGSTAVIAALFDEDPNGEQAGSAYVFE